jgi:hypothetical protein
MRIEFEGWSRNHGAKVMFDQNLCKANLTDDPFPMTREEVKVKILSPEKDLAEGVEVCFGTDMRLGGDQLVTIRLSSRELAMLAKAGNDHKTLKELAKLLQ